ncbi:hypothetical protein ACWGCP_32635 [Streptomyces niveus]
MGDLAGVDQTGIGRQVGAVHLWTVLGGKFGGQGVSLCSGGGEAVVAILTHLDLDPVNASSDGSSQVVAADVRSTHALSDLECTDVVVIPG